MIYKSFLLTLFFLVSSYVHAQDRYWILFTDKPSIVFDPYQYFDEQVLEKKFKNKNSLYDYYDLPLNKTYIDSVEKNTCEIIGISRWLNAIAVKAKKDAIASIKKFSFVSEVRPFNNLVLVNEKNVMNFNKNWEFLQSKQIDLMQGNLFSEHGITGKGIRIAIFDGGFPGVDTSRVFDHLKIVKTWDFIDQDEFVFHKISHGTLVLSCLGGIYAGKKLGLATGSEYLLAITEELPEKLSEEQNWLMAAEWAYQNGADIISSSIGYASARYFEDEMNGQVSLVARAAGIAASKGMLVINSMGNLGNTQWKVLSTPADAESVLAVGAINPFKGYHSSFSSFGPTSDFRMKPNVCASGTVAAWNGKRMITVSGTSFSTPLVAGFAACAWQLNPERSNIEIVNLIQHSASLYPYYDYAHGFGIPQASVFFRQEVKRQVNTFDLIIGKDSILIGIEKPEKPAILYYHIENNDHFLEKYAVIDVQNKLDLKFQIHQYPAGYFLRVFYIGYMTEYQFE